jgi:uncharacterized protein YlxP (DUF503 family)
VFVGVLRLSFQIVGAQSLKDRRRVVKSFKERVIAKFRVSAAEVGSLDDPRYATVAVVMVSNEAKHCDEVLADVAAVASNLPDAILHDRAFEIVPFGEGGGGVRGGIEAELMRPSGSTSLASLESRPDDDD